MRNLIIIMAVMFAGIFLPGCHRTPSPQRQAMAQAEALMDSLPDSALTLLNGIQLHPDASGEERALYALLLSQALDKNYIDVDNDSLVAMADEYYRTVADTRRQMLAAFYHGRVLYNAHDYPRALRLFTESLELATSLSDPFWQARAADELSRVCNATHHATEELEYARRAVYYGTISGKQPYLNEFLLGYANACLNQFKTDSLDVAERLALELLDSAYKYNDEYLRYHINVVLCKVAYAKNDWDRCIEYGRQAFDYCSGDQDPRDVVSISYLMRDDIDSAKALLPSIIENDNLNQLECAYLLAMRRHDYDEAMQYHRRILAVDDSILNESLTHNFTKEISSYYTYEREIKNLQIENIRITRWLIVGICVTILMLAGAIFLYIDRQRSYKLQQTLSVVTALQSIIDKRDDELGQSKQKIRLMLSERFTEVNDILNKYYDGQHNIRIKKQLLASVSHILSEFTENTDKLNGLRDYLDRHSDGVYSDFVRDFPNLHQQDYLLFLYNGIGFSSTAISLLLNVNKESIYNRKGRLKSRIKAIQPARMADYMLVLRDTTKQMV